MHSPAANGAVGSVKPDVTVSQAIEQSGILKKFPELDLANLKVGIYGKAAKLGRRFARQG